MIINIKDASSHTDEEVTIRGWLYNKRSSGKIAFLQIRDGSGIIQGIVFKPEVSAEIWKKAEELTHESSLEVTGKITKHPKYEDEYELQTKDIKVIHLVTEDYPIAKKDHGTEFLLDNRHLWLRSSKQIGIQKVRNTVINAIYEYLNKEGFTKIDAPIFTPSACEETTNLFEVNYFGDKAYLSQSGQLYIEAAMFGVGRCFDFGPVFRAEKCKTRRHLNEFWMMDAEMPFCDHEGNMKIQEELLCHIVNRVLNENKKDLKVLERDTADLEEIKAPFHRIKHKEGVSRLKEAGHKADFDDDFGADEEIALANMFDKPVFIEEYPAEVKAFYMKRAKNDEDRAACNDLLVQDVGELIGGSQREDDYDTLLARIKEHKLPLADFQWYLDLRKYGSVPHSGFGLGLERTVAWLCGIRHVRETIPFPRMLNRVRP